MTTDVRVVVPGDMGKTIKLGGTTPDKWDVNHDATLTVNAQGQLSVANAGGGLDCAEIAALPVTAWKQGTSVLATQDGQCKLLVPTEDIFQEVGVVMTANKLSGAEGDTFKLEITVTNVGTSTNAKTDLTVVAPLLGTYTLSNFVTEKSAGVGVTATNDKQYVITNLGPGGTATVRFDATLKTAGAFTFSANINPNSGVDRQRNNNSASITLTAAQIKNTEYVATIDCPVVDVTFGGTRLAAHSAPNNFMGLSFTGATNVVSGTSLNGLTFALPDNLTVAVTYADGKVASDRLAVLQDGSAATGYFSIKTFVEPNDPITGTSSQFTYAGSVLTLTNQTSEAARISVRPRGANCKWQHYDIQLAKVLPSSRTMDTTLPHTKTTSYNTGVADTRKHRVIGVNSPITFFGNATSRTIERGENLEITLQAGVATTGTITSNKSFRETESKGNIQLSTNGKTITVTTTANVSPADSLAGDGFTIKVV